MNSTEADTGQAEGTEEASKGDRAIRRNDSEIEVSAEMIRAGAEVLNQMDGPLMSETYMVPMLIRKLLRANNAISNVRAPIEEPEDAVQNVFHLFVFFVIVKYCPYRISSRNLFMKWLARHRVVPIISVSTS
jgi:hypothetical protein